MRERDLIIEYTGNSYYIFSNQVDEETHVRDVWEYGIGEMIGEYNHLELNDIGRVIDKNPHFDDAFEEDNLDAELDWLSDELKKIYNPLSVIMVALEFSNIFQEIKEESVGNIYDCLYEYTAQQHEELKKVILENAPIDDFGFDTVGQALYTLYLRFFVVHVEYIATYSGFAKSGGFKREDGSGGVFLSLYEDNRFVQEIRYSICRYTDGKLHSLYYIKSVLSLLVFEGLHVIENGLKFVKCKNCGKYFIPLGRADSLYCSFRLKDDKEKTCRDVGARNTRDRKMKNDVVTQEYRRLYMRLKMAIKRHPFDEEIQADLKRLTSGMAERRKAMDEGKLNSDDVLEWLAEVDREISRKKKEGKKDEKGDKG